MAWTIVALATVGSVLAGSAYWMATRGTRRCVRCGRETDVWHERNFPTANAREYEGDIYIGGLSYGPHCPECYRLGRGIEADGSGEVPPGWLYDEDVTVYDPVLHDCKACLTTTDHCEEVPSLEPGDVFERDCEECGETVTREVAR